MNIKPKTGRRNYAKGGLVEDDEMTAGQTGDMAMSEAAPPLPPGFSPGGRTGDMAMDAAAGGRTGDLAMGGDGSSAGSTSRRGSFAPTYLDEQGAIQGGQRVDRSRPSDMTASEFMSLDSTDALKREERQRKMAARNIYSRHKPLGT